MSEFVRKISMWRLALEERNANLGVMQVFDSMLVFMGEQQREIDKLKRNPIKSINKSGPKTCTRQGKDIFYQCDCEDCKPVDSFKNKEKLIVIEKK